MYQKNRQQRYDITDYKRTKECNTNVQKRDKYCTIQDTPHVKQKTKNKK